MSSTKQLAAQLGVLRTRKLGQETSSLKSLQNLTHLLVIDFESTCWAERSNAPPPEIIEFPVILLCLSTGRQLSEFRQMVMPIEHPRLSNFCTELTGIGQQQVEAGIPLPTCLVLYNQWLEKVSSEHGLLPGAFTCCTWSDWDLNLCLENECRRKQVRKPASLNGWVDIRAVYREFYRRRPQGLAAAMKEVGLMFEGREHSGIEDARNTARLVWKMVSDGCLLQQTGQTETERERMELAHRNPAAGKKRRWQGPLRTRPTGVKIGPPGMGKSPVKEPFGRTEATNDKN